MTRVLLVTPRFPPHTGGGAEVFGTYALYLTRATDLRLFIVTEAFRFLPMPILERINPVVAVLRLQPLRDNRQRIDRSYKLVSFVWHYILLFLLVPLLVLLYRIDIIHYTRYYWRPFMVYLNIVATIFGRRIIVDLRNVDQAKRTVMRANRNNTILCNSLGVYEQTLSWLPEVLHDRAILLPTPFAMPEAPKTAMLLSAAVNLLDHQPYIACCGILSLRKGQDVLIRAFLRTDAYLKKNYTLLLAGQNRFPELIRHVQGMKNIRYLGELTRQEALQVIAFASLYVLPSTAEGVPRSCLEAICLGTRVLVPPGIPEFDRYLPQCVLPKLNVDSLAAAIDRAVDQGCHGNYPFDINDPVTVTNTLVSVYRELTAIDRSQSRAGSTWRRLWKWRPSNRWS